MGNNHKRIEALRGLDWRSRAKRADVAKAALWKTPTSTMNNFYIMSDGTLLLLGQAILVTEMIEEMDGYNQQNEEESNATVEPREERNDH
jgi:hypothetical protein